MSPEQQKNAELVAKAIRNGRAQVTESFAIGQVMLVTGCPYDKAVKGLQAIRGLQLLPQGFIEPKTDGALERMTRNNPTVRVLIARLDLVPGRCEVLEFRPFAYPPKIGQETLKKRFSIEGF